MAQRRMRRYRLFAIVLLFGYCDAVYDVGRIRCSDTLDSLNLKSSILELMVECPHSCLDKFYRVVGSGPYRSNSNICCASIHNGSLTNSGGKVVVTSSYSYITHLFGSKRNGVEARHWLSSVDYTFVTKKIFFSQSLGNLGEDSLESSTIKILTQPVSTTTMPSTLDVTTSSASVPDNQELPDLSDVNEFSTTVAETTPKSRSTTGTKSYQQTSNSLYQHLRQEGSINMTALRHKLTTTAFSHGKATADVTAPTIIVERHFLGLSSLASKILVLVGLFVLGGFCTFIAFIYFKKTRKRFHRWRRDCGGVRKKYGRQIHVDEEFCVCYQNISSSKQGLLYDPETCDRPCPIRKPIRDDFQASLMDRSLEHDVVTSCDTTSESLKPGKHTRRSLKGEGTCKIRYEDDCEGKCSGACSPSVYEF